MMAPANSGILSLPPLYQTKKNLKKNVKCGPSLTKHSGSSHDLYNMPENLQKLLN